MMDVLDGLEDKQESPPEKEKTGMEYDMKEVVLIPHPLPTFQDYQIEMEEIGVPVYFY